MRRSRYGSAAGTRTQSVVVTAMVPGSKWKQHKPTKGAIPSRGNAGFNRFEVVGLALRLSKWSKSVETRCWPAVEPGVGLTASLAA